MKEFERDVSLIMNDLPLWEPVNALPPVSLDPDTPEFYIQLSYNEEAESKTGLGITKLRAAINRDRQSRSQGGEAVCEWAEPEVILYLKAMHNASRI